MAKDDQRMLRGVRIFSDLKPGELQEIEKRCTWKEYAAKEQIIDAHSDTHNIFFIVKGRVRVVDYSLLGQEVSFDDIFEGSHFGEMAALDNQPRSAGVIAVTDSLLASMNPENFERVLFEYPKVGLKVMAELARIIRAADARIMDLSTLGANSRVYAELLRQALAVAENGATVSIRPIPIHGEIASRISTTRETVARAMNDLARKGIVERTKDALVIHDLERLQTMVEQVRGEDRRSGGRRRAAEESGARSEGARSEGARSEGERRRRVERRAT